MPRAPARANKRTGRAATDYDRVLGQRIRIARLAKGISLHDLADMCGLSYQQVQKYEAGKNRVHGARIERLVTALNRPLNYFFPDATEVKATNEWAALLTDKNGQRVGTLWAVLSPADRVIVTRLVEHLAKDKT